MQIYLVGGAVRDQLLGRETKDRDWVVIGATPAKMQQQGYQQVGKDFPVFLHPHTKEEYALARTERKSGRGYCGFTCEFSPDITLEQDLLRRDLTINAMALDPTTGTIIDPYQGQVDLHHKVLRHVSGAFVEDPLRVLRVARFAARFHDFSIAPATMTAMQYLADTGELQYLATARVWREICTALSEQHPQIFFYTLRECKALATIWPELNRLWREAAATSTDRDGCAGAHAMRVLQQAVSLSPNTAIRFAALCHSLTDTIEPQNPHSKHNQGESGDLSVVKQFCQRLQVPNEYQQLACKTRQFLGASHNALALPASAVLTLLNQLDVWRKPQQFADFLVVCAAVAQANSEVAARAYPQGDFLRQAAAECAVISAKKFRERGLQGIQIKQALASERVEVIHKLHRPACSGSLNQALDGNG